MANDRTAPYADALKRFDAESRRRAIPDDLPAGMIDMTSNDYLGLAAESVEYQFAASEMSSSASRLLCGRQNAYVSLEKLLGELYGRPALLFNSGYHANTGCVAALATEGVTIVADKLVHASVIDGIRLSGAPFRRFAHNNVEQCECIVAKVESEGRRPLVITESIFSMDGDCAPVAELVAMRRRHPSMLLYVDEAHAFGVRGPRGLGICEETGVMNEVDIIIGTFGKAAASMGAFAVVSPTIHNYLINTARSLIFSTALPPACFIHAGTMVRRIVDECAGRREHLQKVAPVFRRGIEKITGVPNPSSSHIVPLITGDAARTVNLAARLREEGIAVLPIRRPTVPPGTERIRLALNATLSEDDVKRILELIRRAIDNEM